MRAQCTRLKLLIYFAHMKSGQIVWQGNLNNLDVLVRITKKGDLDSLYKYINQLSGEKTFIRFQGEEVSLGEEEKYLGKMLTGIKNHRATQLLAFSDNQLIGVTDITMKDKAQQHIGIFGITVAKNFRNKGVGSLLMELILKEASIHLPQLKIIELEVFANNSVARNLYQQFGFKEFGILPEGLRFRDKLVDAVLMYKRMRV